MLGGLLPSDPESPESPFCGVPAELGALGDTVRLAADIVVGAGEEGEAVRRLGDFFVEQPAQWTVTHGKSADFDAGSLGLEPGAVRVVMATLGPSGEGAGAFAFVALGDGSVHWRHVSRVQATEGAA